MWRQWRRRLSYLACIAGQLFLRLHTQIPSRQRCGFAAAFQKYCYSHGTSFGGLYGSYSKAPSLMRGVTVGYHLSVHDNSGGSEALNTCYRFFLPLRRIYTSLVFCRLRPALFLTRERIDEQRGLPCTSQL
jgi:hypothetical protein